MRAMAKLDPSALRARFPALARTIDGRPCVFADAPGGTQVPEAVVEAMGAYLRTSNANMHGAFVTSTETDRLIGEAHRAGADLLGCGSDEVVFGPNATTLLFALSRSVARTLGPDDEIVVTRLDHDANIRPWLMVAEDTGATVRWVDIRDHDVTIERASCATASTWRSIGSSTCKRSAPTWSSAPRTRSSVPTLASCSAAESCWDRGARTRSDRRARTCPTDGRPGPRTTRGSRGS